MNRTVLLLLAAVLAPAILGAASLAVVLVSAIHDSGMRRLVVNGVERTYYLYVPDQLPSGAPLVIMLHGYGGDGRTAVRDVGWETEADLGRFVVAGPDASRTFPGATPDRRNRRSWNAGVAGEAGGVEHSDDVGFIVAVIDDLARNVGIDRRRVYVAGFSSGGQMASRLGQEIADRLAAISMSASQVVLFPRPPSRGVSILFSAGDLDPVTPVEDSPGRIAGRRLLCEGSAPNPGRSLAHARWLPSRAPGAGTEEYDRRSFGPAATAAKCAMSSCKASPTSGRRPIRSISPG